MVGDDVFFVADDVTNFTGRDVRIYFHLDDPNVTFVGNEARSDRIRVIISDGVSAQVVASLKSLHTDVAVPSSRLILTDKSPKSRQYLTVFTKRGDISEPRIEQVENVLRISYKQGGERISFLWSFGCSLENE